MLFHSLQPNMCLPTPENAFVYVRGKSMLLDENVINNHYYLKNTIDEHTLFLEAIGETGLKKVLQDLCVPGTQWNVPKQDSCTIHQKSLKPFYRVWRHFVKASLSPCTHNSTDSKERMLLLHSVIIGRKINVGRIIFKEIHECAQKNAGSVFFHH